MNTRSVWPGTLLFITIFTFILPVVSAAGTLTPLTFGSNHHAEPAIDGEWVAWQQTDHGRYAIHVYNIRAGREYTLPHASLAQHLPVIQGNRIVWIEDNTTGSTDLYWSDLPPAAAQLVPAPDSRKTNPVVYGDKIVWQENARGTDRIRMYDISTGMIYDLAPDAPPEANLRNPAIDGDLVAWQDARNGLDWDIWMNDTDPSRWEERQLILDPAFQSFDQTNPGISGDLMVYEDSREGWTDIFLYNRSLSEELGNLSPTDDGYSQQSPEISGDRVIWQDAVGAQPGYYLIRMYNATTGGAYPPEYTDNAWDQSARISRNRLVWTEPGAETFHIFMYTTGAERTCPTADFTASPVSGSPGLIVNFTEQSAAPEDNPVRHYLWDFSDGRSTTLRNPSHIFSAAGSYPVSLTVGNLLCRNATPIDDRYNITIGPPTARFTVTPRTGLVPLAVVVTDTSSGDPQEWNWSFGDGAYAETRTATHVYTENGTYTITLNVSNTFGTSTARDTVVARRGTSETANTTIRGLSFRNIGGEQHAILNERILRNWTFLPNRSVLEFTPPADRGFVNVTLYSFDGTGFRQDTGSRTVYGNITGVRLQSREMILDAFTPEIGPESSFNYTLFHTRYPIGATLNTQIWQGSTGSDFLSFMDIASHSGYGLLSGNAYTTKITCTNLPANVTATLHMSANASWIEYLEDWRNLTSVPRIADDGVSGEILPTVFLYRDPVKNLDYFEANSPHGLSTFGLAQTTGRGNPLQLITLTVTQHASQPEENGQPEADNSDPGNLAGSTKGAGFISTPVPSLSIEPVTTPDLGASAKVYTNADGVVTQATILRSNDGLATISIGKGIVATGADKKPLALVSLRALPQGSLPEDSGSAFTFTGMAYEIGPDGVSFTPPASLTLTPLPIQWGRDYAIRSPETIPGSWLDLPTGFNASTGGVTAPVSRSGHFALFTEEHATAGPSAAIPEPLLPAQEMKAQPPSSAVSIFTGMMAWVTDLIVQNTVVVAGIILGCIVAVLYRLGIFPGSGQ